jgi:two-component system OmpR family response regulator
MSYLDTCNRDPRLARGPHNPVMNQPARILVVDDDPKLRETVFGYLEENNIHAVSAAGRQEMTRHVTDSEPSLVILDLRLGKEDGLDLLREIRSHSDVPVIITTGHRYGEIDRVVGLELGADDYLTEPFGLRELLARIQAVLRRRGSAPPAERQPFRSGAATASAAGCSIDPPAV